MSKSRIAPLLLTLAALVLAAGCGDDDDSDETTAAETVSLEECTPDQLETVSDGTLTVATDKPAFPPYFEDNDPTNGRGFESAVAYAIADQLGYAEADVEWTVVPFNASYAPGPKDFDFDVNQISITPKRAEQVDFSEPVLRGRAGGGGAEGLRRSTGATSLADLADADDRRPDRDHQPRRGQRGDPAERASRRSSTPPTTSSARSRTTRSTRSSSTSRPPSS